MDKEGGRAHSDPRNRRLLIRRMQAVVAKSYFDRFWPMPAEHGALPLKPWQRRDPLFPEPHAPARALPNIGVWVFLGAQTMLDRQISTGGHRFHIVPPPRERRNTSCGRFTFERQTFLGGAGLDSTHFYLRKKT